MCSKVRREHATLASGPGGTELLRTVLTVDFRTLGARAARQIGFFFFSFQNAIIARERFIVFFKIFAYSY